MSDLGDDEWTQMACIEASNIRDFAIDLQPGQRHSMQVMITVDKLEDSAVLHRGVLG